MLLNQVINSKELAESLARECGKNKDEAGEQGCATASSPGWLPEFDSLAGKQETKDRGV